MENKCRICSSIIKSNPELILENIPRLVHDLPLNLGDDSSTGINLEIYECNTCGHFQIFNNSTVYIKDVGSSHAFSKSMINHRISQAVKFIETYNLKNKKVLDIGCGDGHFMTILKNAGANVFGIEPSEHSVSICLNKNLNVQKGLINKTSLLENAPFDGFVCMHVFEHIPDVNIFLSSIWDHLNDSAIGLIEVPNFENSINFQRIYDFSSEHLSYFTTRTLRFALEKNSFEVLEIYSDWENEHLVAIVKKIGKQKLDGIKGKFENLKSSFLNLLNRKKTNDNYRIAIWGASTHSITLLSLINPTGIEFIVDSSEYKQNRYTPVTKIPVFSPSKIINSNIDLIIVMAPRYTREILNQLKNEFDFKGEVIFLNNSDLIKY
jgi:2-polyprenyl-3-methyl-5-hydroxy-6-metoxy-1,4-benzoquinol methylase